MKKVGLFLMLCVGMMACVTEQEETAINDDSSALTKGDSGDPTTQFARRQCRAFSVSLRYCIGCGEPYVAQIGPNELIEVHQVEGAWFRATRLATGQSGWTLAEYYCPL
jgi:hypothetical protein